MTGPVDGCVACDLSSGRRELPGGVIHRTRYWVVEHCVGPLGLGTLIVKPGRHVTELAALSDDEAAELGPLLRRASWVAGQLVQADQVYNCLWCHGDPAPRHIHYVVQPVTTDQTAAYRAHGPGLQVARFAEGERPDPGLVAQVAARARDLFAG